jgi:ABC-2 type transport system permease protein
MTLAPDPPSAAADGLRHRTEARETVRLASERRSVWAHIAAVWEYRELLKQLVRKELKVKYRGSVLGFLWSLLNPLFMLTIYYLVFQVFLGSGIRMFPIWLLTGLLVWGLHAGSVVACTGSIVGNSYLVGKVRFPREIMPFAAVGASLFHFLLQGAALLIALSAFTWGPDWAYVPLLPFALVVLLVFVAAVGLLLAAMNVYARDTQHLLELGITAWFWLTPVLVPYGLITQKVAEQASWIPSWVFLLNPVTPVVITFQRALYGHTTSPSPNGGAPQTLLPDASVWWYARNLAIVAAVAVGLFYLAMRIFDRVEGDFAEVM